MWKDEVFCNGLIYHEEGKVIQWPHLLVFEKPPLTEENVYNMVQDFNFQGKKAILRGAILGDGSTHFESCVKLPNQTWLQYNGFDTAFNL